jgi:hypothetical protein
MLEFCPEGFGQFVTSLQQTVHEGRSCNGYIIEPTAVSSWAVAGLIALCHWIEYMASSSKVIVNWEFECLQRNDCALFYSITKYLSGRHGVSWLLMILNPASCCHLYVCDHRRGIDRRMDLLTTLARPSELQVIIALSLAHARSSYSSLVVSWQRILTQ